MSPSPGASAAPDSAEPLLGWRVWTLSGDGLLGPITGGPAWTPGENCAVCFAGPVGGARRHSAPGRNCRCGFNALFLPPMNYAADTGHALGAIAAWGEIEVYRTGFRAERACVLGLLASPQSRSLHQRKIEMAGRHYGVRVASLAELGPHVRQFASTPSRVADLLEPPRRVPAKPPLEPPPGVMPHHFSGRGVWMDAHLACALDAGRMRVAPTPALAALARDRIRPAVDVGAAVRYHEPLLVADLGPQEIVVPAPVDGRVRALNPAPPIYEEGPADGWVLELEPDAVPLDATPLAWGRPAAESYRERILASGSDADVVLVASRTPAPLIELVGRAEARGWLESFAALLADAARSSTSFRAGLAMLGCDVSFELPGHGTLLVGPNDEAVELLAGAPASERARAAPIRISLSPRRLREYWCGEVGLGPVDSAVAGTPGATMAPLVLERGERSALLLALSIHQRLFARMRTSLGQLPDPWFRAGDTVRDPVANLRALAGFDADALGNAA